MTNELQPPADGHRVEPMSLWHAAYLWAVAITEAGGRARSQRTNEAVRVLITFAITVEARHWPGLVPRSGLLDGPGVLARISMVTLLDRQLHTFLDAMLGLLMCHGAAPAPWEPGYAEFQSLQDSLMQVGTQSAKDIPDWEQGVAIARNILTNVITQVVTEAMTDVPLALLGDRPEV